MMALRYRASMMVIGAIVVVVGIGSAIRASRVHAEPTVHDRAHPASTAVRGAFETTLDSLAMHLALLGEALSTGRDAAARVALADARRVYKRSEYLVAYYAPTAASTLIGPAEVEDPDLPPPPLGGRAGFVQIADALDAHDDSTAARVVTSMRGALHTLRGTTTYLDVSDTATLDAARLELTRVMTLGVVGFDTQTPDSAIVESAAAIDGIQAGVNALTVRGARFDSLRTQAVVRLANASAYLRATPDFGQFDRLEFIANHGIPAARAVLALRQAIDDSPVAARRLWRPTAATPFERDAFDVSALAPEYAPKSTPALVEKGRALFSDPRLSGPGTRSCASCHKPAKAFADGLVTAAPIGDERAHLRNTPTLINAALQQTMFADERAGFVEDQVRAVLASESEMASSADSAARRVGMGERDLRVALAAYIRSLTALNSRFDRAIRGDASAMNARERNGFNLFEGKAKCGTCHFAPLFGGTMPPEFTHSELEIVGIPRANVTSQAKIDADSGRSNVDHALAHQFAFRVPSLRNVELTAPYMHNGVYRTLDQVIEFYDRGGGVGIGETLPSQTLDTVPLHLTSSEKRDLIAFLKTLTDTSVSVAKP